MRAHECACLHDFCDGSLLQHPMSLPALAAARFAAFARESCRACRTAQGGEGIRHSGCHSGRLLSDDRISLVAFLRGYEEGGAAGTSGRMGV